MNRKMALAGASYIISLILSEGCPVSKNIKNIPQLLSVHFIVDYFPRLQNLPAWLLYFPAVFFFFVSILPVLRQKFRFSFFFLVSLHFLFFPLVYFSKNSVLHPIVWSLLIFPVLGLNLWVRSLSYFYSMMSMTVLWDLGAAVRGYSLGYTTIGVPYHSALAPNFVIIIDIFLLIAVLFLWIKKVDFGKFFGKTFFIQP